MRRKNPIRWLPKVSAVLALALAVPISIQAQYESASQPSQDPQQTSEASLTTAPDKTNSDSQAPEAAGPGKPIDMTVRAAGTVQPWGGPVSFLRWGPFSIANFEYTYVHDRLKPVGDVPTNILDLHTFHTSLAYDWKTNRNRLVLQYSPTLVVESGAGLTSVVPNHAVSLSTTYDVSSRLTISFSDGFVVARSRQIYSSAFLQADTATGNVLKDNFLSNSVTYFSNSAAAFFNYRWSPRTTLTVSPSYVYSWLTTSATDGQSVMTSVAVTHALSSSRNIGIIDSVEYFKAVNLITVGPQNCNNSCGSLFNTASLFYSQQLSPVWWIQGRVGAEVTSYRGRAGSQLGTAAGGSLVRKFQRSSLSLGYDRGRSSSNYYISNQNNERVDVSYGVELTRRITWTGGVGYFHELDARPRTQAKYASTGLGLHLRPDLTLYGSYTYRYENSPSPQLLPGTQNTVMVGVRWQPAVLPGW